MKIERGRKIDRVKVLVVVLEVLFNIEAKYKRIFDLKLARELYHVPSSIGRQFHVLAVRKKNW